MRTRALTHVAMSVAPGALSSAHRAAILDFYGGVFGWRELTDLSNEARLTIAVGPRCYINVREHPDHSELAYEHFGVLVRSADDVGLLWHEIERLGGAPEPLQSPADGLPSFQFRHLLPMAIEVQYFPEA